MADANPTVSEPTGKACSKCKALKTPDEFYKDKRKEGKLTAECRACVLARQKKANQEPDKKRRRVSYYAEYRKANQGKIKEWFASYRADPKNREKMKRRADYQNRTERSIKARREYDQSERAKRKASERRSTSDFKKRQRDRTRTPLQRAKRRDYCNRPEVKERLRLWYRSDKGRANAQRRFARRKGLPADYKGADVTFAREYWCGRCAACGKDPTGTKYCMDHWIPLTAPDCPGTVPCNMVPLCGHCNFTKHAKRAEKWLAEEFGDKADSIMQAIKLFLSKTRATDGKVKFASDQNEG